MLSIFDSHSDFEAILEQRKIPIADRLRNLRKNKAKNTQEELAEILGFSVGTIKNWEKKKGKMSFQQWNNYFV